MENDDISPMGGCLLLLTLVIVIVMAFCEVNLGIIILVGLIMLLISIIAIIAGANVEKQSQQKSLDSYYQSAYDDDHHIRIYGKNVVAKPNDSDITSDDNNKDDHENYDDAYDDDIDCLDDDDLDDEDFDDFDNDDYDDDCSYEREENLLIDKDMMLTSSEYHEGRIAIKRLIKLIERMSQNSTLRETVINSARDRDTVVGKYSQERFYTTLNLLLGKDIIYCYEYLGLDTEMHLYTPENQLLLVATLELADEDGGKGYAAFRRELLSTDPVIESIRDTHEEMYNVFRNQTDVKVTTTGEDDFQLVLLVKSMDCANLYLKELRDGFLKLAEVVAKTSGMNDYKKMMLESLRHREDNEEDVIRAGAKHSACSGTSVKANESSATIEDLNALIGLIQVKKEVTAMMNFIEVNKRREEAGMKVPPTSYHCVFTGNPGTGKTTVARIVAGIYKELGILKKGHLIETDRSGLVAEYVGQTAVKTNKVIDSALDGVLFVDEAYSLVGAGKEDFGKEAIATLVKRMEDNRDRLVVILAGYEDEMQQFINSNPGLRSRFNRYIHFEDYSADELKQIYLGMLKKYDFILQNEGEQVLKHHLEQCVTHKGKDFGNARYVRNLFERSIKAQAVRLAAQSENDKPQLETITAEDITNAIADNP